MAKFRYIAVSQQSQPTIGVLAGASRDAVAADLARQGMTVLEVRPQSRLSDIWDTLNTDVTGRKRLRARELAGLSIAWGGLIDAGLPLDDALALSARGLKQKPLRDLVERVLKRVKEGKTFHASIEAETGAFPPTFVALVRAAEATASLGTTLTRIAGEILEQQKFRSELRNALLYPAFVSVTAGAAIVVLLTVVVPNIESLFTDAGRNHLPQATRAIFAVSQFLRLHGMTLALGLLSAAIGIGVFCRTVAGQLVVSRILLQTPFVGRLIETIEAGRFLRLLSELLAGGVALERAVPLSATAVANRTIRRALDRVHDEVRRGVSLNRALDHAACLPDEAVEIVRIGEQTGKLVELTKQIALLYEQNARSSIAALSAMIGPVFTIVFGAVAGTIVYIIMSTILSLNGLAYQ